MATDTAPAPLLNLDTFHAKTSVVIDGTPYQILAPNGLSLMALRKVRPLVVQLEVLRTLETLTDDQHLAEKALLDGICRVVLDAPADVHAKLDDLQRLAVYLTFLALPSSMLELLGAKSTMGASAPTSPSTGASSSRGLSGSIPGADRTRGSRASRKRSSGPAS